MTDDPSNRSVIETIVIGLILFFVAVAVIILSSGCATCSPCVPKVEVQEVYIPVYKNACEGRTPPQEPEVPQAPSEDATSVEKASWIQSVSEMFKAWARQLYDFALSCSEPSPEPE